MLLRHRCDQINVLRGLTAPIIFFFPFYGGLYPGFEFLSILFLWLLLNDINHVLHLHVHCPFSHNKAFNRLLDVCMGITTGMTASVWRIQHVYGHHRHYLHSEKSRWQPGREWETREFSILGAISYSTWTIVPVFYHAFIEAFTKGVLKNIKAPINYRYAFAEQLSIFLFIVVMLYVAPILTLSYLLPWYFLVQFVTRYTDYLNHFGCGGDLYNSSNNSLNYWYNKLGCNFGYHSAHHFRPTAHWSTLPALHSELRNKIPDHKIKAYSWSGFYMPYHFLLSLFGRM